MLYDILPVSKPRQTRADKWKKRPCVLRYREFADECRLKGVKIPESDGHIIFYIPMPKSWSKNRKQAFNETPHQQKPDIDNCLKAVFDAVLKDDSGIHDIRASKVWAYNGCIEIIN